MILSFYRSNHRYDKSRLGRLKHFWGRNAIYPSSLGEIEWPLPFFDSTPPSVWIKKKFGTGKISAKMQRVFPRMILTDFVILPVKSLGLVKFQPKCNECPLVWFWLILSFYRSNHQDWWNFNQNATSVPSYDFFILPVKSSVRQNQSKSYEGSLVWFSHFTGLIIRTGKISTKMQRVFPRMILTDFLILPVFFLI